MRALTSKEKKLLAGLLAVLFVMINLAGLRVFLSRHSALKKDISDLEMQVAAGQALLAERTLWEKRAGWLDANQPEDDVTTTEDNGKFYDFVKSSATKHRLQFTQKESGDSRLGRDDSIAEVFYSAQVKGKMEDLVKWMHELQDAKQFRVIKQIAIKSGEPPEMICDIVLARWYRAKEEARP